MLQVDWCCPDLPSIVLSARASAVLSFLAASNSLPAVSAALASTLLAVSVFVEVSVDSTAVPVASVAFLMLLSVVAAASTVPLAVSVAYPILLSVVAVSTNQPAVVKGKKTVSSLSASSTIFPNSPQRFQ